MEKYIDKYAEVLAQCALFRNIKETDLSNLLGCLGSKIREFKEDEYLFLAGDEVNYVGIVLKGSVEVMKENLAGNKHILAFINPSQLFAEGIVCTVARKSPVTVRVRESSVILWIPYDRIINSCGNHCSFHINLIQNMMVILGEKNVILNRKLEILTLKGMREKIASFLLSEANGRNTYTFQIPMNRSELSDYLNVSRTSMCRELTRMKEEGLIDYYGNSFKIMNIDGLGSCLE